MCSKLGTKLGTKFAMRRANYHSLPRATVGATHRCTFDFASNTFTDGELAHR
jgi:hypothetical protein